LRRRLIRQEGSQIPFVMAAMAAISTASSLVGASKAKSAAKGAAREEARLEGIVTEAKITSLDREERVLRGETLGAAAGSNVKVDRGSPLQILAEQARTFADEKRVVRQAGASRAAQAKTRGRMVGDQAMYQGVSQAANTAASAFSMFSQMSG